jgi:hypothetical protein
MIPRVESGRAFYSADVLYGAATVCMIRYVALFWKLEVIN